MMLFHITSLLSEFLGFLNIQYFYKLKKYYKNNK